MAREQLLKLAKPILFNTEMVRAILEGRKTETRRVIKGAERDYIFLELRENPLIVSTKMGEKEGYKQIRGLCATFDDSYGFYPVIRTAYKPGDALYVRETWNYGHWDSTDFECQFNESWFEELPRGKKTALGMGHYVYRANFSTEGLRQLERRNDDGYRGIIWHPSIHMPKEAARIFLRVTDVSVERLQDITVEGCKREGIYDEYRLLKEEFYPKLYAEIWDRTVKDRDKYGWDANPWVWVIKFERVEVAL